MHDDIQKIFLLLSIAEKAREYPKLKLLHDQAINELEKMALPPVEEDEFPMTRVFPADSGVVEKETDQVTNIADRRV